MLKKSILSALAVCVLVLAVFADQAAYVSREDAIRTASFLKTKTQVTHYCAPCGTGVGAVTEIKSVEAKAAGKNDLWEVKVNDEGVDLAYTYYLMDSGKWKNVAIEMGIPVKDVPTYLPEKKERGR